MARALLAAARPLRKLRALLKVVGAQSVADIDSLWDTGSLAAAGLGPAEMAHLLLAISGDSPGRRAMLAKLAAAQQGGGGS